MPPVSCKKNESPIRRCSPGFTLIELLVVVSIISLLVAILLPALSMARASAQTIRCASNHRQIAYASLLYASDYREYIPPAYNPRTGNWRGWYDYLHEYFGRRPLQAGRWAASDRGHVLDCPMDERGGTRVSSYGANRVAGYGTNSVDRYIQQGNIYKYTPAPDIVITAPYNLERIAWYADSQTEVFFGTNAKQQLAWRHQASTNSAFLDGRVERVPSRGVDKDLNLFENDSEWKMFFGLP